MTFYVTMTTIITAITLDVELEIGIGKKVNSASSQQYKHEKRREHYLYFNDL